MGSVQVDWGDGQVATYDAANPPTLWAVLDSHVYATRGTYHAKITGVTGKEQTLDIVVAGPEINGAATTYVNSGAVGTVVLNRPPNAKNGDMLIACLRGQVLPTAPAVNDFASDGWTRLDTPAINDATVRLVGIYYRPILDITKEPASYTFTRSTLGRVVGAMIPVSNCGDAQPADRNSPYGGVASGGTNTRTIEALQSPPTALQIFMGGAEFSANSNEVPTVLPDGMAEFARVTTDTNQAVSRTSMWAGSAVEDDGEAISRKITWGGGPSVSGAESVMLRSATTEHIFASVADMLAKPGFTWAHRANSTYYPEHSMYAYQQAVRRGYSVLEMSLARTSDGVWFGLHDEDINRTSKIAAATEATAPNLLTAGANGTFDGAVITGWTGTSATPAASTTPTHSGTGALKGTWAAAAAGAASLQATISGLTVGQNYQAYLWVYVPTGAPNVLASVDTTTPTTSATAATKDAWVKLGITFVATAVSHVIKITTAAASTAGQIVNVDDVKVYKLLPPASQMTWAEINSYQILTGTDGSTAPYLKFEDFFTAFGNKYICVLDPKYAWTRSSANRPEFWAMVDRFDPEKVIVKAYVNTPSMTTALAGRANHSWGYAYQADVEAASFATLQAGWETLGLNYDAPQATWDTIKTYGKPVIGHICTDVASVTQAITKGANGVQCGGSDRIPAVNALS